MKDSGVLYNVIACNLASYKGLDELLRMLSCIKQFAITQSGDFQSVATGIIFLISCGFKIANSQSIPPPTEPPIPAKIELIRNCFKPKFKMSATSKALKNL